MSKKGYAKFVIAAGILIMLWGLNMDVTVGYGSGRVANIHLISQKQTLMMFGGFVFLGGLILFGVARIKQTPEDEAREDIISEQAAEARRQKAETIVRQGAEVTTQKIGALRGNWKQLTKKLFAGFVVGLLAAMLFDLITRFLLKVEFIANIYFRFGDLIFFVIILGAVIAVMRRVNYINLVKTVLAIEVIGYGILLMVAYGVSIFATLKEGVFVSITFYLIVAAIALFMAAWSERKALLINNQN